MMWTVVILLTAAAAVLHVESYGIHGHERLAHGRMLKIYLSKNCEVLQFIPAEEPYNTHVYWEKGRISLRSKGHVSGSGNDKRWYIDKVTYRDQGTYIQKDYWNKELSTVKVAVTPRHNLAKFVKGEKFYISLEGMEASEATLQYSDGFNIGNVTLVRNGMAVGYSVAIFGRSSIEIEDYNATSVGLYTLTDRWGRVVSTTRMDVTDHHDFEGNPLMALLLLLGIPAGICCCCRKKIFKKKATNATTLQTTADSVHPPPPSGPVGPVPPYATPPGQPGAVYYHGPSPGMGPAPPPAGPGQWNGPPAYPGGNPGYPPTNPGYAPTNPGYPPTNPGYPPTNPGYPMAGPAMGVPGQPPQWNGPAPGQYPPGPAAPMGYAAGPVMYSAAPPEAASEPVKEEAKVENNASSPADPLLATKPQEEGSSPPVPPSSSTNALGSVDPAYKFEIDSTANFL